MIVDAGARAAVLRAMRAIVREFGEPRTWTRETKRTAFRRLIETSAPYPPEVVESIATGLAPSILGFRETIEGRPS